MPDSRPPLVIIRYDPSVADIVTGAGLVEVNFKTHKVTLKVPEKFPGWAAAKALDAALQTWHDTNNVKELEGLRTHAEQLVVSSTEAVMKATARV
jgi:hypothetical protein